VLIKDVSVTANHISVPKTLRNRRIKQ